MTTVDQLRAKIATEVNNNGGAVQLIGYQFGAIWAAGQLFPREPLAAVMEAEGFPGAAKLCREITGEKALASAVRAKAPSLCSQAARYATARQSGGETVVFHVEGLEADAGDGHVRAWGIYREVRRPGEESSSWEPMGARLFVTASGVYAAPPKDTPDDPVCAKIAQSIVAHAGVLLSSMDNTLTSAVLTRAYQEAGAFTHLCEGLRLGLASAGIEKLVTLCLRLRAECAVPVSVEPRFKGGISESHVSESLVRSVQADIEKLVEGMRVDAERDMGVAMLDRRRAQLQEKIDYVGHWRSLLSGWDGELEGKLRAAKSAYDSAVSGAALSLPDWAKDDAPPPSDPFAAGEPQVFEDVTSLEEVAPPVAEARPAEPVAALPRVEDAPMDATFTF